MSDSDDNRLVEQARRLLQGAFQGVLSTHSTALPGYPLGSLVPFSLTPAGWPLLLLSHLAQHSRNLQAQPRASLTLVAGSAGDAQQQLRLCLVGDAEPLPEIDPALAERHFRHYPQARDYQAQLNFHFWQLRPLRCHCVGGFGAARWLSPSRLADPEPLPPAVEAQLLADLAAALPGTTPPRQPVGIDPQGVDLLTGGQLQRLTFARRCSDPAEQLAEAQRLLAS